MSKEIFSFTAQIDVEAKEKLKSGTINTMKILNFTLLALADSGKVPLELNLKGKYSNCPKAVESAFSQLNKVKSI